MKMLTRALIALLLLYTLPAAAQETGDANFALSLAEYNAVNPKQSDLYMRGSRVLDGRVFDAQNRVLGEVQDVVFDTGGNIVSIQADLSRISRGQSDLPLNYSALQIRAVQGGYLLAQATATNKLEDVMAQILSSSSPASGNAVQGLLGTADLIGSPVASDRNVRIGVVEDVVFQSGGAQVYALLLRINYKSVSGKSVAIPVKSAQYARNGVRYNVMLSEAQAQTLLDFAK